MIILKPLEFIWACFYHLRRILYRGKFLTSYESPIPVISVGNLSFGGTGKTPLVLYLINFFQNKKYSSLILTRGYKSELENKGKIISANSHHGFKPQQIGDEPFLILENLKKGALAVGKNRVKNLSSALKSSPFDVAILDDGFQHLKVARDLNLLLLDSQQLDTNKWHFPPLGYWREGLHALVDADFILFTKALNTNKIEINSFLEKVNHYLKPNIQWASLDYKPVGLCNLHGELKLNLSDVKNKKAVVFCGIGHPTFFISQLKELGVDVVETIEFSDHHSYSLEEINQLLGKIQEHHAIGIMTEKDKVKVAELTQDTRLYYLSINVIFLEGENQFLERISSVIK
jgi:tetraacyldisaccharide 4'-kinase